MPRLDPSDPRLAEPDYPHGTETGYDHGCSCTDCRAARAAAIAERRRMASPDPSAYGDVDRGPVLEHLGRLLEHGPLTDVSRATGVPYYTLVNLRLRSAESTRVRQATATGILTTTPMQVISAGAAGYLRREVEATQRHIAKLLTHEGATPEAVAKASGVSEATVADIIAGRRSRITKTTANAIRRLKIGDVLVLVGYVPSFPAVTRIRALQANRWPFHKLSEMLGRDTSTIVSADWIPDLINELVEQMFDKIGDRPGDSPQAAAYAAGLGYYPPIHYDEDMTLLTDSIPGPSVSEDDPQMKARRSLRIMGLTIREHTEAEINNMLDTDHASGAVQTARRKIGLKLESGHGFTRDSMIKPGQGQLVELIAEYLAPIAVYERTEVLDEEGLDYVARWRSLANAAKDLRAGKPTPARTENVSSGELVQAA